MPHSRCTMIDADTQYWFVLSAVFGREVAVRDMLENRGLRAFVPMHYVVRSARSGKRKEKHYEPVVRNWVFVYATHRQLQTFKAQVEHEKGWRIALMTRQQQVEAVVSHLHQGRRPAPLLRRCLLTVPEGEMEQFIRFSQLCEADVQYLLPEEVNLTRGERVRILGGAWDGMEGYFVKIKGKRARRFVIEIPGLMMASTAEVEPEFIQKIKD